MIPSFVCGLSDVGTGVGRCVGPCVGVLVGNSVDLLVGNSVGKGDVGPEEGLPMG